MKKFKIINDKGAWMDSFTSCFLGTVLGIIITIGTTIYSEHSSRKELEQRSLFLTVANMHRKAYVMKTEAQAFMRADSIYQAVMARYPHFKDVSEDTVELFVNSLANVKLQMADNTAERIFSSSIEIWETIQNDAVIGTIGSWFSFQTTFDKYKSEIYTHTPTIFHKIRYDYMPKVDDDNPSTFLDLFFSDHSNRVFLDDYHMNAMMLNVIANIAEQSLTAIKREVGITDEQIEELFEQEAEMHKNIETESYKESIN